VFLHDLRLKKLRTDLEDDKPFLAHLKDTLELMQETVLPFDTVALGIMDLDLYTHVVATKPPLGAFARRETLCAHTINQLDGPLLYLPDMRIDPRFAGSPFVTDADLVSYVGAPLRFVRNRVDGTQEEIVLGTLCATHFGHAPPALSTRQQRAIVRFADIITNQIVERARATRLAERHVMDTRINALTAEVNAENAVDVVLAALRMTYLDANVSLQHHIDDNISLLGVAPVPHAHFVDDIHEATTHIEAHIVAFNHLPTSARTRDRTLRAVAVACPGVPHTFLVVQTVHLTHVFDDIDVAFVRSCASILAHTHRLVEAERVPCAAYFREFSEELRTPIHTILRSCVLLIDDTKSTPMMRGRGLVEPAFEGTSERSALLHNALASEHVLLDAVDSLLDVGVFRSRPPVISFSSFDPT
jgi:hypothetical protein